MNAFFSRLPWLIAVLLIGTGAARRAVQPPVAVGEESVALFENRKAVVALPEGFQIATVKDPRGLVGVRIADRHERISLEVTFLPDAEERFSDGFARKEFMHEVYQEFLGGSVEQAMQFEELDPKVGRGTYCVFTDKNLVGKADLPPNEFLNVTTGVKAWPGVVALFTMFSNGTQSPEYRAAMTMLRDSVHERIGPLR